MLADGTAGDGTPEAVRAALASQQPFWLDVVGLDAETTSLLTDDFKIHPLAIEDVAKFGQRPKLESYGAYVHLVLHGAADKTAETVEVHCFYSAAYLITVRRTELASFEAIRTHAALLRQRGGGEGILLLYRVVDAVIDSFFPVLDRFDDAIDTLEDEILASPNDEQLGTLFEMKRQLVAYRKVVTPERDVFAGVAAGAYELPGMTPDAERYYRDIYDHLIRISDLVDSYRDLLTGAVDTHLSVVSNRLNVVMKQLAVIATIFLPLTYLTGFFGQNFSSLVNKIAGPAPFFGIGIGLEVLAFIALIVLFKKRHWM